MLATTANEGCKNQIEIGIEIADGKREGNLKITGDVVSEQKNLWDLWRTIKNDEDSLQWESENVQQIRGVD